MNVNSIPKVCTTLSAENARVNSDKDMYPPASDTFNLSLNIH